MPVGCVVKWLTRWDLHPPEPLKRRRLRYQSFGFKGVVAAGVEPALAAFSTPCLFQLGYATVDVKWHPWWDSHPLGSA